MEMKQRIIVFGIMIGVFVASTIFKWSVYVPSVVIFIGLIYLVVKYMVKKK